MNIKVVKSMRCFNCYSEFVPTLSKPICKKCCLCHYCRDFTCFHHDLESPTKVCNATQVKYDHEGITGFDKAVYFRRINKRRREKTYHLPQKLLSLVVGGRCHL